MSWKKPYRSIAIRGLRVRLNREVALVMEKLNLWVDIGTKGYAVVIRKDPPCTQVELLHDWVWRFYRGNSRPKKDGEIVHHLDENKLNNTIDNLGVGTRAMHQWVHRKSKQRFRHRARFHSGGFHRPHAPGPVKNRPDEVKRRNEELDAARSSGPTSDLTPAKATSPASPRSVHELRSLLAERIDQVRAEVATSLAGATAGRGIKQRPWRESETYLLGLQRPARLSRGDAVIVGYMIAFKMDREALADALGVAKGLIDKMLEKPAVHEAIRDWQRDKTLPYLLLPRQRRG